MPPLVSVVLPAHNAAATVARAVAGTRAQTLADWELLTIDDGSTDDTPRVLAELADVEPRLRVLSPGRVGLVAALNVGLAAARGSFLARLDADDEVHPGRLAAQVSLLQADPNLGLASCLVTFGGDRARHAGYAHHVDWLNTLLTPAQIALNRFIESPLAHPSVLFRRELVERHGGYRDGDFPEDYELWLRWLAAGVRMAKVPRPLLTWHDSPDRLSRTDPRYTPEAFYRIKAPWLAREVARVSRDRPIWLWGAGKPTRQRAAHLLDHGVDFAGYLDIDPRKIGQRIQGLPVRAPSTLPPPGQAFVLSYVANRGARDPIRAELATYGYVEGQDFLCGA